MADVIVGRLRAFLTLEDQLSPRLDVVGRNLDTFGGKTQRLGNQLQSLGTSLSLGVTAPIVAMGVGAVKAAIDFESSFAGVGKTVDGVMDQAGRLTDLGRTLAAGFRQMAKEIPVGVNELNRIGEAAGQLGIQKQNILDFTRVVAELGATTNLSTDEAATSLARLANITQLPQDQFRNLASAIVDVGNKSATTEREIVEFGLRIAGAGEIAGLTEAQIVGIGAAMSSVGVEAEAGGTAVQKVLLSMTEAVATGSKDLATFAQTARMSATEFADAFRHDAGEAFTVFVEGLGQQGQRAFQTLEQLDLQDQRLIRSFVSLAGAGDLLADTVRTSTDAFRENVALTEEAEKRFNTTESKLIKMRSALNDAAITLGEALIPRLAELIPIGTKVIEFAASAAVAFGHMPDWLQTATIAVVALTAAIGPTAFVGGTLLKAGGSLIQMLGWFSSGSAKAVPLFFSTMATSTLPAYTGATTAAAGATTTLVGALSRVALPLAAIGTGFFLAKRDMDQFIASQEAANEARARWNRITSGRGTPEDVLAQAGANQIGGFAPVDLSGIGPALTVVTPGSGRATPPLGAGGGTAIANDLQLVTDAVGKLRQQQVDLVVQARAWVEFTRGQVVTDLPEGIRSGLLDALESVVDAFGSLEAAGVPAFERLRQELRLATGQASTLALTLGSISTTGGVPAGAIGPSIFSVPSLTRLPFESFPALAERQRRATEDAMRAAGLFVPEAFTLAGLGPIGSGPPVSSADATVGLTAPRGSLFTSLFGTTGTSLASGLNSTIISALVGGGDVGRSAGGFLGSLLGGNLASKVGGTLGSFLGPLGALGGSLLGKGISAVGGFFKNLFGGGEGAKVNDIRDDFAAQFGGLNEIEKRLASIGRSDLFAPLAFGPGKVKAIEAAIANVTAAFERADAVTAKYGLSLDDVGSAADRLSQSSKTLTDDFQDLTRMGFTASQLATAMADDFNALARQALETGVTLPAALRPLAEELARTGQLAPDVAAKLLGLTESTLPNWRELQAVAEEYGIALEALGPKFQQSKLNETAEKYARDFALLTDAGADVTAVLDGMDEKANEVVQTALRFGLEIPASMRPLVEALAASGRLIDENGDALTDLSRIKFAETISDAIDRLIEKLDELFGRTAQGYQDLAENIARRPIDVQFRVQQPDLGSDLPTRETGDGLEPFDQGTGFRFRSFSASGTPVVVHNEEAIVTRPQGEDLATMVLEAARAGASGSGRSVNVTLNIHTPDADGARRLVRSPAFKRELIDLLADDGATRSQVNRTLNRTEIAGGTGG